MPSILVTFLWSKPCKSPVQIQVGKSFETSPASLGMESKSLQYHSTAGTMLSSKHGTYGKLSPAIPGCGYKNDWCIDYAIWLKHAMKACKKMYDYLEIKIQISYNLSLVSTFTFDL